MKTLAEDLKQKLERIMAEPANSDPGLRRIKYHLIPDLVQDLKNQLEKLEERMIRVPLDFIWEQGGITE